MKNYYCFSMKRSGHHAVIHWIMCNSKDFFVHYNCCNIKNDVVSPESKYGNNTIVYDKDNNITDYHKENISIKEIEKINNHISARMYSFEDYDCNIVDKEFVKRKIVIIRDVYNMLASSVKQNEKKYGGSLFEERMDLWLKNFNHAIKDDSIVLINYNNWFSKKNYRDLIGNKLGFKNEDVGISYVPRFGDGSSFDKRSKEGVTLDVLNRYSFLKKKHILRIKKYEKFEELKKINKQFFNLDFDKIFPQEQV